MSALFDEDREAERIAGEYVAEQQRIQDVEIDADCLIEVVWKELVTAATAKLVGQDVPFDEISKRAYGHIHAIQDLDVRAAALIRGLWPFAIDEAERQLEVLRDFHYVDENCGLIPTPPPAGRHRAMEEP